ncbi:MAG: alkaline phosphatase family protein [Anaerolineales bacterium]|nr:alkaline phosphatase family protein [Anaerolineales bacterium]
MKTLIIGLDAFDPKIFESLHERNGLPNLSKYVNAKGYSRFSVANPPQSEVSWTSIASGLNPGGHGIFDFVHRDPETYQPYVSLLPTKQGLGGTQFVPPHNANTIFQQATRQGYPATALWWPTTFPARLESPVRTIPGLGTPDIHGRLGVGTLFTTATGLEASKPKTAIRLLEAKNSNHFVGILGGPSRPSREGIQEINLAFQLEVDSDQTAHLKAPNLTVDLVLGKWSPILEFTFKVSLFYSLRVVTRVILTSVSPEVCLYFLPLQIHPLKSPWRYATPPGFVKDTWKTCGPYLTLGWPQDTTGLEEGWINDMQFLELCDSIRSERERVLHHHFRQFNEGLFAIVFDCLDRIQHMFWRDRPDIIEAWYHQLDQLVGQVENALSQQGKQDTRILVVSDHGFTNFDYKVHLNRWLSEHGYLVTKDDSGEGSLKSVDWSKSQAYAIGLNSIYLNIAGREGQGSVPFDQKEVLSARLCDELSAWEGPQGNRIVEKAYTNSTVFEGPFCDYGPDILVGYASGFRASQETGLGSWKETSIEANNDHWGADHCIEASVVPGVLFCNQGLANYPHPSYKDIPPLAIDMILDDNGASPPPQPPSKEEQEILEERLKSLGYL